MNSRGARGIVLLVVGVFGVIAGAFATVTLRQLAIDTIGTLDQSLQLTLDSLETVGRTVSVAEDLVRQTTDGLGVVEETASNAGEAITGTNELLTQVAVISGDDVPRSLESLQSAMPSLIQVANVIDGTLGALSFVGVPYHPDVPFDDALEGINDSLAGMPEQLRNQADLIQEAVAGFDSVAGDATKLADTIHDTRISLLRAQAVLAEYDSTADQAQGIVDRARSDLDEQSRTTQMVILLLGAAFILGQVVPLFLGWEAFNDHLST